MAKRSTTRATDPIKKDNGKLGKGKSRRRNPREVDEVDEESKGSGSGAEVKPIKKKICVNRDGNVFDLRPPVKPPQVVISKTRVTRKVQEKLTLGKRSGPKVKANPKVEVKASPPDTVGEVYWAAGPVSKFLRSESNPSRPSSSPAIDHTKQVEDIISSFCPTSNKLPRCNTVKTESVLELASQALKGRSLSIPKLPKAVSLERIEPHVDASFLDQEDLKAAFLTNCSVAGKGPGEASKIETQPPGLESLTPERRRNLLRFHSVPASMPLMANLNEALEGTFSGSILEPTPLNSSDEIILYQLDPGVEPPPTPAIGMSPLPPKPSDILEGSLDDAAFDEIQPIGKVTPPINPPAKVLAPILDGLEDFDVSLDDLLCDVGNQVSPTLRPAPHRNRNLEVDLQTPQLPPPVKQEPPTPHMNSTPSHMKRGLNVGLQNSNSITPQLPPPIRQEPSTYHTILTPSQTEFCIPSYDVNPPFPQPTLGVVPNQLLNLPSPSAPTSSAATECLPQAKHAHANCAQVAPAPSNIKLEIESDPDDMWDDSFGDLLNVPNPAAPKLEPPPLPITEPALLSDDFDISDTDLDDLLPLSSSAQILMSTASHFPKATPPTPRQGLSKSDFGPPAYHQCLVVEVQFQYYSSPTISRGQCLQKPEKRLRLYDQQAGIERVAHLRDSWLDTKVQTGDCVNIIGDPMPGSAAVIIDDAAGYLILNPNVIIASSHLTDSFACMRRATLSSLVRTQDSSDKRPLTFGNMLHTILQQGMLFNRFDEEFLGQAAKQIIRNNAEGLYLCEMDESEAEAHIQGPLARLREWAERYVGPSPRPGATYHSGSDGPSGTMSVSRVLEVEENVFSPMFGLKGKIDATVLTVEDNMTRTSLLEFKTGRAAPSIPHRAQTLIYLLMMSERYQTPIQTGWLFYLLGMGGGDMMTRISAQRLELRAIMQTRNEMTTYLQSTHGQLPVILKNPHVCKFCPMLSPCATYHAAVERGTSESSGLGGLFGAKVDHLSLAHKEFFQHWERLLTLEEGKVHHLRQQSWCQLSDDRSKSGDCLNEMLVLAGQEIPNPTPSSSLDMEDLVPPKWFNYKLAKRANPSLDRMSLAERMAAQPTSNHLPRITFGVGDPVLVSVDSKPGTIRHVGLAVGFVKELHLDHIVLNLDRKLKGLPKRSPNFHPTTNQAFEGEADLDFQPRANLRSPTPPPTQRPQLLYRIDKDEMTTGMLQVRNNLVELMVQPAGNVAHLRSLVVDLVPPAFRATNPSHLSPSEIEEEIGCLNPDQQRALRTVLAAQDYTLILGMPGTGKTTTIARMIRLLVRLGKSVLIAAHTHSAVDTVLCKLLTLGFTSFLRLGNVDKVNPRIRSYTPPACPTVAVLRRLYETTPVVATTCLGVTHPLFLRRSFDYCIIDEASQVTLPICLGPLRFASKFVLVGDHYQLPPLVRNAKAKQGGLANSLFKRLSEAHLRAVVHLQHQYRMNQDIMDVANALIYQDALCCGSPAIATSMLVLPNPDNLRGSQLHAACSSRPSPSTCWLMRAVESTSRVIFFDTDSVPGPDEKLGELTSNPTEVAIVSQVVQALILGDVMGGQIGIVSPYRSQLALLSAAILPNVPSVEVLTIDRAQGRDKDCIILSMVRSNPGGNVGDLLRDWRRINVAITRARHKLIVVGSFATLNSGGGAVLGKLVALTQSRGWLYTLPRGAPALHKLPWPAATARSSRPRSPYHLDRASL